MERICTVTAAADGYIGFSECFADLVEIRGIGEEEREYRYPIGIQGSENLYLVFEF